MGNTGPHLSRDVQVRVLARPLRDLHRVRNPCWILAMWSLPGARFHPGGRSALRRSSFPATEKLLQTRRYAVEGSPLPTEELWIWFFSTCLTKAIPPRTLSWPASSIKSPAGSQGGHCGHWDLSIPPSDLTRRSCFDFMLGLCCNVHCQL